MFKKPITALKARSAVVCRFVSTISMRAVMKRAICMLAGLTLIIVGAYCYTLGDAQNYYYNKGMSAYNRAMNAGEEGSDIRTPEQLIRVIGDAKQAFEKSRAAYKANQHGNWLRRFLSPQPDAHMAAMSAFQEAKLMLALKQPKEAVKGFQLYLQIVPGGTDYEHIEDQLVDQYDLEMLMKKNPNAGDGSGQGNGPGDQPNQGNQAGKNQPTKI